MKLEYLRLKNFRAFRDVEMKDIPRLAVLVGANGTGKSTLFQVFGFLRDAMRDNVHTALTRLGGSRGFAEVRSRDCAGDIEIELKFRQTEDSPRISYELHVAEENDRPVVTREVLKYRRGSKGQPWNFLNFSRGTGVAVTNEVDEVENEQDLRREEQTLKNQDILAIKGLAQFERFPAVVALGELIENWHVSDFHISKARPEPEFAHAEHLSTDGDNLALVIQFLFRKHRDVFDAILKKLSARIPGLAKVEAKTTEEGRVLLRFQDGSFQDPFLARHVSDGTIKMLAYLVLLHDPNPHPLLCIEEPENQLYPSLLAELAEEFRDYANRGGQVFVSTHSPDFLNATRLEDVFWLVKSAGYTAVQRAQDDPQIAACAKDGDLLGALWKEGLFPGADPRG
ncbi:MAG: chromosome segregation protein SMC [Planctomycetaceae bacterium]|nr:MAG: chromosome segregation protein SMC [Planctomycetaceae bacterium]